MSYAQAVRIHGGAFGRVVRMKNSNSYKQASKSTISLRISFLIKYKSLFTQESTQEWVRKSSSCKIQE